MPTRVFGDISGIPIGTVFPDRAALARAGVHRPLQGGISGSDPEGADSIVLSGGYEDDEDRGDEIVYTGHGGKDQKTGKQIHDQKLTVGNLALARSQLEGLPVRVIRGAELDSPFAPPEGYRYDGLYVVEEHWSEPGRSGFVVWRYRLRRYEQQPEPWPPIVAPTPGSPIPKKTQTTILRIVRSTPKARAVKKRHGHICQVCRVQISTKAGPYAEGAHIKGLGAPHNGPDVEDNILCLCANHHVMFDAGTFSIAENFALLGLPGRLRVVKGHNANPAYLAYHRSHHGFEASSGPRSPGSREA